MSDMTSMKNDAITEVIIHIYLNLLIINLYNIYHIHFIKL